MSIDYNSQFISIITPVFNSGSLLRELHKNLSSQGYDNIEWILINDGSKDPNTLTILEEISMQCAFARVYHQENKGAPSARNYGFGLSSGQFVTFLDADDLYSDRFLIEIGELIGTLDGSDNCMIVSPVQILEDRNGVKEYGSIKMIDKEFFADALGNSLRMFPFHHSGCIFSRDLALKINWDENLQAFQDLDYLWSCFLEQPDYHLCNSIHFINREHSYTQRITTTKSKEKWFSRIEAVNALFKKLDSRAKIRYQKNIELRINLVIANSLFESPKTFLELLQKKNEVLGWSIDFPLFVILLKRTINRLL